MKADARCDVVEEPMPPQNRNVVSEQVIRLTGAGALEKCPQLLRRVEVVREDTGGKLVFLNNLHHPGASTVAASYKDRCQIELFFKALKRNLKIKTFVVTSANAVKKQTWTALICRLLLRYLQLASCFGWSMSNLVALRQMNLFTHRDLMAWVGEPLALPDEPPESPPATLSCA